MAARPSFQLTIILQQATTHGLARGQRKRKVSELDVVDDIGTNSSPAHSSKALSIDPTSAALAWVMDGSRYIVLTFIKTLVCNRCHESFASQDLLFQHQRLEDPCHTKATEFTVGKITLEQAAKLGAMKKKKPHMSDEMRWFELYEIIFPGQDPAQRPLTPYHQPLTNPTQNNPSSPASISISSYRDTFLGPSNQMKKRKLEGELEHWGVTDPGFRRTLAAKVQDYQFQELQEFIEGNGDPSIPIDNEPNNPQPNLDNSWAFDFSQVCPADFFDWTV
ncbi:serine threonine kinase [Fusarium mexicanum]|uniref:Serine threonine kinase n=1 Tax=Fusarium mexicanum TaxID=751941 RepID=A0A8H5NAU6_9HYPO|nr:serine threonine kinase [Fusarium mexicanum]